MKSSVDVTFQSCGEREDTNFSEMLFELFELATDAPETDEEEPVPQERGVLQDRVAVWSVRHASRQDERVALEREPRRFRRRHVSRELSL